MRLNETLANLEDDHIFLGEWLYFITTLGKPSAMEPWGWQFQGHHAIINYFVLARVYRAQSKNLLQSRC
jgi:hypothetical protein